MVVPLLVIAISFWAVILKLYRRINATNRKVVPQSVKPPLAPQVSSNTVDHISAMAVSPPQSAWDPEYLIERDPRYLPPQSDSCEDRQDSYSYEGQSDTCQTAGCLSDSQSDWESEGESDYQSDEYTDRGAREDTEDFTESDADILDTYHKKNKFHGRNAIDDTDHFTESDNDILDTHQENDRFDGTDPLDYTEGFTESELEIDATYQETIEVIDTIVY